MKFILFVLAIIGNSLAVPFAQNEENAIASSEGLTFKDFFPGNESDTDIERIVGGSPAPIERFPWQISVSTIFFSCSGALISTTRGLTLASCVQLKHEPETVYRIVAGTTHPMNGGFRREVRPILHPRWRQTGRFNIAVLILFRPVPLGPTVRPIALPQPNAAIPYGVEGVVSGWGTTSPEGNPNSPMVALRYTVARALTNQQCNQIYGGQISIPNDFVCASVPGGGRGPCGRDTGSPLVVNGVLVGLVASVGGCGRPNAPAIYTRVPYLVDWVRKHMF